ncbi:hypothetical protein TNCV_63681 [Trichonephila clavipes]|nr:hypothetical protein TNCV_63681 [Trichonephila clavipes]
MGSSQGDQWLNGIVSFFPSAAPGLGKVDSAFHSFSRSMSTKLAWDLNTRVSRQTGHLTETSAHAPQRLKSRKLR